ncbi:MAG: sensor domain-containing diguanylate cyclase [Candidatus Omnitrophica bacterium]|nr:sensor domain-containing diguanylate cyclase [Candidatus Omnitrophota bacterium]
MAKFYLIISILAILALPFWIKLPQGVYPIISNFALLPLGVLAYLEGFAFGLIGAAVCILSFFLYCLYVNVKFASSIPILFAFGATPIVFWVLKSISKNVQYSMVQDLEKSERRVGVVREEDTKKDGETKELDKKVSEIATLYEITKGMSSTLLFGEIFQIFSEFLKKNFHFLTCRFILAPQDQEVGQIKKVYKIESGSPDSVAPESIDKEILKEVFRKKAVVSMKDFVAAPLMSQDRIIGALSMNGLNKAGLERFLIVSRQFSLAIEKVRLYEKVQKLAITDGLTGVFVRRYFLEMLKEEFERSLRHQFKLSFIMIDLDRFKECNDTFGHLVGDVVLREVAKVLKQNVREIDLLGRYGGEEFSLLLPETDKDSAALVAERLRWAVADQTFKAYDEMLKITISAGISTFPDDGSTGMDLIEAADEALYKAKTQGRNRVVLKKG